MISDNIKFIMYYFLDTLFSPTMWQRERRISIEDFSGFGLTVKKSGDKYTVPVVMFNPNITPVRYYEGAYMPLFIIDAGIDKFSTFAKVFQQWPVHQVNYLVPVKIKDKIWYIGAGIMLSPEKEPIFLCTIDVRNVNGASTLMWENPTIYLNPKLFVGKTYVGLRPYFTEALFQGALTVPEERFTNPTEHPSRLRNISFRMGGFPDFMIRTQSPAMNANAGEIVNGLELQEFAETIQL